MVIIIFSLVVSLIQVINCISIFLVTRFDGSWSASSAFNSITTPLGVEVLGGKAVVDAAEKDLGSLLQYKCSFISQNGFILSRFLSPAMFILTFIEDSVISDRVFNVVEIAKASMGNNSVISTAQNLVYIEVIDFYRNITILPFHTAKKTCR